jgi:hypothetical protein
MLITGAVPEHVKTNAIIELTSFCQKLGGRALEAQAHFGDLLAEVIAQLRTRVHQWDSTAERQASALVASLRIFRQSPTILGKLLPGVVDLVQARLGTLSETFGKTLEAIDLDSLDHRLRESIYRRAEDEWLKAPADQCGKRVKDTAIPVIIRLLKPDRRVRTSQRYNLPLAVEIYLMQGTKVLKGEGIDIGADGFCIEVEGMLVGEQFQGRRSNEAPFQISEGGVFTVEKAELWVRDYTGTSYVAKGQEVDVLRAWRSRDEAGGARTGLAGRILAPAPSWHRLWSSIEER